MSRQVTKTDDVVDITAIEKETMNIVQEGKGKKLSPKTDNHVFYQLAVNDGDAELYIRLSGNEGGGLHSKEWIKLQDILAVLDEQHDKPFKSTVLKSVFKGSSANNTGFLAAVLRGMGLIIVTEKSVFLYVISLTYSQCRDELLALVGEVKVNSNKVTSHLYVNSPFLIYIPCTDQ